MDKKEIVIKLSYTISIFYKSNVKTKKKLTDHFPYIQATEKALPKVARKELDC